MKKIITIIIVSIIIFNTLFITAYAYDTGEISMDDFYSQVNCLISNYDTNDGLASGNTQTIHTNRLIVKTQTNEALQNYYGAVSVVEGYDGLHFLQYLSEEEAEYAYKKFSFENIEYVEYDFYMELCTENITQTLDNHITWNSSAVQVDEALSYIKEKNIECEEVRVAVIDTGIYKAHEFFAGDDGTADRIIDYGYTYDVLVTDDSNNDYMIKYPSTEDGMFHGTFVSGVIYDNSMENVKIVPFRITNSLKTPYSKVLHAFTKILEFNTNEIAEDDIDIVNMSFRNSIDSENKDCITLKAKFDQAIDLGMILVAAAGNENKSANNFLPASYSNAITVSSTDKNDNPAEFSNFGTFVDVGAPGVDITSPSPRLFTDDNDDEVCPAYNAYMTGSGTSYSAPLVAAAAATLKSIIPDITPAQAEKLIKETAYVPEGWDFNYGAGIVDFYNMVKTALQTQTEIKLNSNDKFEIVPAGCIDDVYYTLDGTDPTPENGLIYFSPLDLSNKTVPFIKAASYRNGEQIGETATHKMFRYETIKMNYKETKHPISSTYTKKIRWKSSDSNIATVDSEGNIKGVSVGETQVTAKLSSGKRIVYNVKVEYSRLQWFIMVFLCGFLWY